MLACSCVSLGDVSNPPFYLPLIPILIVFYRTIYRNSQQASTEQARFGPQQPSIAWLHLKTLRGARAWLVFYLLLAVVELWESYCILRIMLNLWSGYWSWNLLGAPLWLMMLKQLGMLQLTAVFGVVMMICVGILCFKVVAIGELGEWMLDAHRAAEDTASSKGEEKRY